MSERSIALVTDTTACIPRDQAERYDIEIVPARLDFGEGVLLDTVHITAQAFYSRLRECSELPHTMPPSVDSYLEGIVRAGKHASSVLCVIPARGFSAFSDTEREELRLRAAQTGVNAEIIPNTAAAGAQGLLVTATARAAADGLPYEEVLNVYRSVSERVQMLGALDTLDYLVKSKRVPSFASMASSLLNIKPVFHVKHGELKTVARPVSMDGAIQRMVKFMESNLSGRENLRAAIMHADAFEKATVMKNAILERFSCLEWYITEFTPVMGVHTGPGLVGVAFFQDDNV